MRTAYGCPVEFALELLGGKWKSVILARLTEGPLGYGEIRRLVPGVSDKVLTERLRDLEGLGLVERRIPNKVVEAATPSPLAAKVFGRCSSRSTIGVGWRPWI